MIRLIDAGNIAAVQASLPRKPYYSFLADISAMAALMQAVVPRLHDCFASTRLEWYVLQLISQSNEIIGNEYLRAVVHEAAMNSRAFIDRKEEEFYFLYITSYFERDNLTALSSITRTAAEIGWSATTRLAERAFHHEDRELLALALERLSFYTTENWESTHPILEYKVTQARYDHLLGKAIDPYRLIDTINEQGDKYHRQIFLYEVCSFLKLDPHTTCVLAASAYQQKRFLEQGRESEVFINPTSKPD